MNSLFSYYGCFNQSCGVLASVLRGIATGIRRYQQWFSRRDLNDDSLIITTADPSHQWRPTNVGNLGCRYLGRAWLSRGYGRRHRASLVDESYDRSIGTHQIHCLCKGCRVDFVEIQMIKDVVEVEIYVEEIDLHNLVRMSTIRKRNVAQSM